MFRFLDESRSYGISTSVVAIPKELKRGCGLSVEIPLRQIYNARLLLNSGTYLTFSGIYSIKKVNGKNILQKLG